MKTARDPWGVVHSIETEPRKENAGYTHCYRQFAWFSFFLDRTYTSTHDPVTCLRCITNSAET